MCSVNVDHRVPVFTHMDTGPAWDLLTEGDWCDLHNDRVTITHSGSHNLSQ